MQVFSAVPAVALLTRLYVANLRRELGCPIRDLDYRLLWARNGRGRNERTSTTSPPRIFSRIWKGKWPNNGGYWGLRDSAEKFNLVVRVEANCPGSRAWLMEPLKRAAQSQPHRIDTIGEDIEHLAARLGLRRIQPGIRRLLAETDPSLSYLRAVNEYLINLRSPSAVCLLTLWFIEATCIRPRTPLVPMLHDATVRGWRALVTLPGLFNEGEERQVAFAQVTALLKNVMYNPAQIWPGQFARSARSQYPMSGFWAPTPQELATETSLAEFHANLSNPDFIEAWEADLGRQQWIDLQLQAVRLSIMASALRCACPSDAESDRVNDSTATEARVAYLDPRRRAGP